MSKPIYYEKDDHLCKYGCGQIAHYHKPKLTPSQQEIWCCEDDYRKCPEIKKNRKVYKTATFDNNSKNLCRHDCGEIAKFRTENGWQCSISSNSCVAVKVKKITSCQESYGVDNPSQSQVIKQKKIKTCRDNFGTDYPTQSFAVLETQKKNNLEKYGVEWTFQNPESIKKKEHTNIERYGVKNAAMLPEVQERMRLTCIERYGSNMPNCSKGQIEWLDSLNIPIKDREVLIESYRVDGFDPETNTVYEYNGDFWHGNPGIYNPDEIHPRMGVSFGEIYQSTLDKVRRLEEAGYTVISIWESEWKTK